MNLDRSVVWSATFVFCAALDCGCVAPVRTLPAPDGVSGFGTRIIVLPDIDGDGTTDVAVSARSSRPLAQLFSGATGARLGEVRAPEYERFGGTLAFAENVAFVWRGGQRVAVAVGDPDRATGEGLSGRVTIRPLP